MNRATYEEAKMSMRALGRNVSGAKEAVQGNDGKALGGIYRGGVRW